MVFRPSGAIQMRERLRRNPRHPLTLRDVSRSHGQSVLLHRYVHNVNDCPRAACSLS